MWLGGYIIDGGVFQNQIHTTCFIPRASNRPLGMGLPRTSWVKLNCRKTGGASFHSSVCT